METVLYVGLSAEILGPLGRGSYGGSPHMPSTPVDISRFLSIERGPA